MDMDALREFENQQTQEVDRPLLKAGDVVRVEMKITEGEKSRLQTFEGTILSIRGSGPSVTFTVRRETGGFGVERIFPLYSPLISNIEIVKRQKVRRAKLHYLRQAGRRRFKEDVAAMQRHIKEEAEKQRLADEAARKEAEAQKKAEEAKAKAEAEAKKKEEAEAQATTETEADAADADSSAETSAETEEKTE